MSMSLTTGQTRAQLLDPWRVGDGRIEYADETVGRPPTAEVVPWPDRCFAVGAPEQRDDLALMHALLHLTRPRARDRIAGRSAPSDAVVVLTLRRRSEEDPVGERTD